MIVRTLTLVFCAIGVYFLGTLVLRGGSSRYACSLQPRFVVRRAPCELRSPAAIARADGASSSSVDVVDVSPFVVSRDIPALIHLRPGEHVTAVGDCAVLSDGDAAARIATRPPRRGAFIDLTVSSAAGDRRVLVLRH
jgi:hypothetical protein